MNRTKLLMIGMAIAFLSLVGISAALSIQPPIQTKAQLLESAGYDHFVSNPITCTTYQARTVCNFTLTTFYTNGTNLTHNFPLKAQNKNKSLTDLQIISERDNLVTNKINSIAQSLSVNSTVPLTRVIGSPKTINASSVT